MAELAVPLIALGSMYVISKQKDDKKKFLGKSNYVFIRNGKEATKYKPAALARIAEEMGAGEIIIQ